MSRVITPLTLQEVRDVYHNFVVKDFPRNERKTLKMIEDALERNEYQCFCAKENDEIQAYAFFVRVKKEGQTLLLLDYLSVKKELRDKGVGSWFLQNISKSILKDADIALLEVDNPDYAKDVEELSIRNRRLKFYLRNGLQDTSVRAWVFGAEYSILEIPVLGQHGYEVVKAAYEALYQSILPPRIYARMVKTR